MRGPGIYGLAVLPSPRVAAVRRKEDGHFRHVQSPERKDVAGWQAPPPNGFAGPRNQCRRSRGPGRCWTDSPSNRLLEYRSSRGEPQSAVVLNGQGLNAQHPLYRSVSTHHEPRPPDGDR
jgi:hypothetical protein